MFSVTHLFGVIQNLERFIHTHIQYTYLYGNIWKSLLSRQNGESENSIFVIEATDTNSGKFKKYENVINMLLKTTTYKNFKCWHIISLNLINR